MADSKIHGQQQEKGFGSQIKGTGTGGYTPSDHEKETFSFVYNTRYRKMKESPDRQDFIRNLDRWEKQWEGLRAKMDKPETDWQSNHVVPLTISVVQTAVAEIVRQNLRPFFRPRGPADQPTITLLQHIWDYAWETAESDLMMYDVLMDMLIAGSSITQEYFRKDYIYQYTRSLTEDQKMALQKHKVLDYNDVYGEIVKPQEFYIDETARRFGGSYGARDCIRRYIMDIDDFHMIYDDSAWDQFGNAHLVTPGGDTSYYEWFHPPEDMDSTKQVEVLWYWAERPVDRWVITANHYVIRDGDNPYNHKKLPYCKADDVKRVHRFYAKGEPEILESAQNEANTLRRMIIDRNHLDIDKMFFVSNKLALDDEDTMARPHGIIPTDDVAGAKAIEYGDIPRSVELSLQKLEDDATVATGINPRAEAIPQATTATEAAILKESTLRRIESKVWMLKKSYLRRLGELRFSNILQFYKDPEIEKIVGEEASMEYKQQMEKLEAEGRVKDINGEKYAINYRQIPIKGNTISFGAKGQLSQEPTQHPNDYTFFSLLDKSFLPIERGRFVVRFDAGPNIEISKPLQRQQDLETFDRIAQIMQMFPGIYDPEKVTDQLLFSNADKNPDDFKPDQAIDMQVEQREREQMSIQMANMENSMMLRGVDVPSTAYASPAHTLIHIDRLDKEPLQPNVKPEDKKIMEIMTNHIMGELMAQQARESMGGQGIPPQQPQPFAPPGGTTAPNFQNPQGTNPTSISQGITNRPNGMSKPRIRPGQVVQQLNPGGQAPPMGR